MSVDKNQAPHTPLTMNNRPVSVTVISWMFITAGVVGIIYHATEFKPYSRLEYEVVWSLVVRLLAIVGGVFALLGARWARWLLLIWIGYHVVLSAFHSVPELIIHGVLFAVVAYVLFRASASAYFLGSSRRAE